MRNPTHTADDNLVGDDVDDRLTAVLDKLVSRRRIHHANLAIVSGDGQRRWAAAAGDAGPGDTPLTPATPFFVASITKRFIITLVLQAHERGELHLDDAIVDHLPETVADGLHVYKGVDHTSAITIRHLASHTSGLPDHFEQPREGRSLFELLAAGEDRSWNLDDVVRMAREQHQPFFAPQDLSAPQQRARYSDTGFQLLIAALEHTTGRSFAELLHDRILEPVGMAHTWLPSRSEPAAEAPEPALIHTGRRPLELPQLIESSNDLISTAADLIRFQAALDRGALFAEPATAQRLTERSNLLRNMPPNRYGVGTWLFRVNRLVAPGRKPLTLLGHAGATGTWLFTCPELDVHLVGAVDQAKGQRIPFGIMLQMLRVVAAT